MESRLFIRATPQEKTSAFNARLLQACQSSPVTSYDAHVVDGQPAIMLHSELDEADDEDVAAAKEDGETIKKGDLIPVDEPLIVQVTGLGAVGDSAARSEALVDRLNKRGDGGVMDTKFIEGEIAEWVPDVNEQSATKPKQILSRGKIVYLVMSFAAATYNENGDEEGSKGSKGNK